MDVDAEGQLPFLVGDVLDGFEGRLMRCVVDENVNATEFRYRLVGDRAAMLG
jgi:hypothetical protein